MAPFRGQFTLPRLERVIAGPGALASLTEELDRYGCRRAVIVTGATLGASPLVERVRTALRERCAAAFTGARQHVPSSSVDTLLRTIDETRADSLVSVGGGSPIDTAKCAVHALIVGQGRSEGPVHIAVPTTLSAGEFTDVAGWTDEATGIKHALRDVRIAPRTVIADPEVTVNTPDWLWAASGIRALDHAVETLYSDQQHPLSEPLATRAIERLIEHLPPSLHDAQGSGLGHRGECQMAAWLAVFGVTNAGFGLSHVLGHQIGPRWNVAHGFTSAIMLPHVMRYMADAVPHRFASIAGAFGIAFDPANPKRAAVWAAERTAAFIAQFGLPTRLRDAGVLRDGLGEVANVVCGLMQRADVIDREVTPEDLRALLDAAY